MRVLFVIPSCIYSGGGKNYSPPFPHLGIAYLTSILQYHGIEVKIVDMRIGYSMKELSLLISDWAPKYHRYNKF